MCRREEQFWQRMIEGLRAADSQVTDEFCRHCGDALHRVVQSRMDSALQRRFDAEDVVQSAFRTFFRHVKTSRFQFEDSQKLWNLLCAIALTKVRQKVRFHFRQKRGIHRETQVAVEGGSGAPLNEADPRMTPDQAAEFAEQFELLVSALDQEEQQIVALKLEDQTNEEIGKALRVSERTVRRILKRVRSRVKEYFEQE